MQAKYFPNYLKLVAWMTVGVLAVFFIRNAVIGNNIYSFLLHNLLAGFMPLLFAYLLFVFHEKISPVIFWIGCFLWLLFYPNSPYMISDLIHADRDQPHILFSILIIFAMAMLSLFYGFLSLKIMFTLFKEKLGRGWAHAIIIFSLLLSSLGFYMGRVLLFFSQDFLLHPLKIVRETWEHLFPIGQNLDTYAMMLLFTGVQFMLLVMMKDVNDIEGAGFRISKEKSG